MTERSAALRHPGVLNFVARSPSYYLTESINYCRVML